MKSSKQPDDSEGRNLEPQKPESLPAQKPPETTTANARILHGDPAEAISPGEQLQLFFHERLFVGPLPPPDLLRDYGKVDPTLPDRIVSMAEREQAHRHSREIAEMEVGSSSARRAQICATLISVIAILVAVPIGIWGNEWAAGAIGTVGIVGYLAPILLAHQKQTPPENPEE